MSQTKITEFYNYFKNLKEYVTLSNIVKRQEQFQPGEQEKVKKRIDDLAVYLEQFRKKVYQEIQANPTISNKVGKKVSYHCTNKKCRHKFEALKHPFLTVIYNCPKCKSFTIELI